MLLSLGTNISANPLISLRKLRFLRFVVLLVVLFFLKCCSYETNFTHLAQLTPCGILRRSEPCLSVLIKMGKIMSNKVWLTDAEVGTRFGSTRQWVWSQARSNPNFPKPVKLSTRWSRWSLQEIEAFEQAAMERRVN